MLDQQLSVSMAMHSRVNVSTTVRQRIVRPVSSPPVTKSIDHSWLAFSRSAIGLVDPVHALGARFPALFSQQDRQTAVAVSRLLPGQFDQRIAEFLIEIQLRLVAVTAAVLLQKLADRAFAQAMLGLGERHRVRATAPFLLEVAATGKLLPKTLHPFRAAAKRVDWKTRHAPLKFPLAVTRSG
ncbi:MAG TPA: hypothetical protein VFQ91_03805 [Bryobacteraceae bacterium]|nr:hypothetical protein [Bryobacteraceae bacterium]